MLTISKRCVLLRPLVRAFSSEKKPFDFQEFEENIRKDRQKRKNAEKVYEEGSEDTRDYSRNNEQQA
jgi:hypothetical protein